MHKYAMSFAKAEKESLLWQQRMVSMQVLTVLGGFYTSAKFACEPRGGWVRTQGRLQSGSDFSRSRVPCSRIDF